jgi:MFS transporter, ACS family, solute carrier family 17 (sodium-dependent inorganic phosphate cotransporter), other
VVLNAKPLSIHKLANCSYRSGLLYSLTSLPGVIFGSVGVYMTGQILDATHQDWSYVFSLNSFVDILGATAFVALYNSTKEFD